VAKLLAGLGRVLRTRAETLTVAQKIDLYSLSSQVSEFDCFISHVCSTPGFKKYVTLVLDQLGVSAFVSAFVMSLVIFSFQAYCRPLPRIYDVNGYLHSIWEFVGGVTVGWSVLVFGHTLCRRTRCFFDCVSICQHDPELKAMGIMNIPAFLRASRAMVVLWDERYFTRLWCVYEIAVAHSIDGLPIRILPTSVYALVAVTQLYMCVGAAADLLFRSVIVVSFWWDDALIIAFVFVPLLSLQAYNGRRFAKMYAQLQEQFETFDVRRAAISVESDRSLIYAGIEELFDGSLDNFNSIVRTTLKSAAMGSLTGQRAVLPYWCVMWQLLSVIPATVSQYNSYLLHMERPLCVGLATFLSDVTGVFCCFPLLSAAALELGRRSALGMPPDGSWAALRRIGVGAVHIGVVGVIAALYAVCRLMAYQITDMIGRGEMRRLGLEDWHCLPWAVLVNGATCVAAVWAFRPRTAPTRDTRALGPGGGPRDETVRAAPETPSSDTL